MGYTWAKAAFPHPSYLKADTLQGEISYAHTLKLAHSYPCHQGQLYLLCWPGKVQGLLSGFTILSRPSLQSAADGKG